MLINSKLFELYETEGFQVYRNFYVYIPTKIDRQ